MGPDDFTSRRMPALSRALERRYPGIKVESCEHRTYQDHEGITVTFECKDWEQFVRYGLAPPIELGAEIQFYDGAEGRRWGYSRSNHAHLCCHWYDGDPPMPGKRTFPLKKTVREVERIWKRISRSPSPA